MLPLNIAIAVAMAASSEKIIISRNRSGEQIASAPRPQDHALSDDIVVLGNKANKYNKVIRHIESITRDLNLNNPLARYAYPICLDVSGIRDEQDKKLKIVIQTNFELLKIPYNANKCRVNASVFFVDNPNAVMKLIYKKSPMLFGALEHYEISRKLEEKDKSISIQNIIVRGVDGDTIVGKAVPSRSASIIDLPIRRDIESSIVLIDRRFTVGYSIKQLSSFLTFRILANVRTPYTKSGQSILEMFNMKPSICPEELTRWDISYLKEIYAGNSNVRGVRKVGQIARRMLREDR